MNEALAESLVPVAARLVATVRDYGPDDVRKILAEVPDGRHDALAVVLAAMVNPDRSPRELLAWVDKPPPSRPFTPSHLSIAALSAEALGRRAERRAEVARLSALGFSVPQIAERVGITTRSVVRHRAAIRRAS